MKLSARTLKNVDGLNAWSYSEAWVIRSDDGVGETVSLYFQVIDEDRDGIRYVPGELATTQVTFPALDDAEVIVLAASFPFADDRSIMKIDLASTQVPKTGAVRFAITEGGVVRSFTVYGVMQVEKINSEIC